MDWPNIFNYIICKIINCSFHACKTGFLYRISDKNKFHCEHWKKSTDFNLCINYFAHCTLKLLHKKYTIKQAGKNKLFYQLIRIISSFSICKLFYLVQIWSTFFVICENLQLRCITKCNIKWIHNLNYTDSTV